MPHKSFNMVRACKLRFVSVLCLPSTLQEVCNIFTVEDIHDVYWS